ncbi:MAG: hypothetical protein WCJ92_05475 [Alphaproteobacteria bacterium]
MKNIATQLITQKFCKFFYLLACLAIFSNINASTTITFNDQDVSSVVTAFTLLQQRQTDDPIAQEIVAKSAQTLKGKVAALHQFNERLRKRQEDDAIAEAHGLSPVKPGENLSDKISAKAKFQQAAAAIAHQAALQKAEAKRLAAEEQERKLQADMLEEREKAADQLRIINAQMAVLAEKAALLTPTKEQLKKALQRESATPYKKQVSELTAREAALAAELKRLKSQMGGDVLETILEERADASGGELAGGVAGGGVNLDEEDPLKLELASYYGKIKGINKRLAKLAEVLSDCECVQTLYNQSLKFVTTTSETIEENFGKKTVTRVITSRFIPDSEVAEVLMRMSEACGIANKYKTTAFEGKVYEVRAEKDGVVEIANGTKKEVKAGELYEKFAYGTKEKMEKANPEERVTIFNDAFLNIYTEIPNNEKMKIGTIDHLQLSLDLTLNLEASILSTKKLGLYADSDFLSIDQTITSAISNLRAKIEERDKAVFNEYMSILAQERTLLESATDFSARPLTVQLLRDYRVLFMLKRPAKKDEADNERTAPFASFERLLEEIRYLTENQKKALFASLYYVVFNYEQVSGGYLRDTLLSNTPIQAVDIHPLIKQVKEALKTNSAAEKFDPIVMTQNDLRDFSTRVNRLIAGDTYRESVTNRFVTALIGLGQKFNGISREGIDEYLKTENLSAEEKRIANRILAEHEFVSREALNQQLVAKKILLITHKTKLEQSISEKRQTEEEARIVTEALEEGALAKSNAQREKKEKENEIETFSATIPEHEDEYVLTSQDEDQFVELGQKYEILKELDKELRKHTTLCTELDKKSKKLAAEIELLTKKIQGLETNIAAIEPEIEKLVDTLKELGFVSELERLSGDIDVIASRGNELFEFNRTLEICFELITGLQASTRKLVEAKEATAIASASIAKPGKASEKQKELEVALLKVGVIKPLKSAALKAKKLKTMALAALAAAEEKREAEAEAKAKREADELAAVAVAELPKPLARPAAFAAPVALDSATLMQELVLIEAQVELKKSELEDYQAIIDSIAATRVSVGEGTLPSANMKIKNLKKRFPIVVVLPPPPQTAEVVVAELPKPPARPAAFAAPVVTAESLEQELVLIEAQLADKQIDEEVRASFIESIKAARANIETAIPTAQMKINKIKRELKKL